eukprot:TRINITY_DN8905_c0_g1_i1.p1 TRINITY_DN8905_c0_g1~~TRINITY_DN8905_c0_g1_i1.p1  ORF type:complete len:189 (+),score=18.56 TRINITY_DN8905_c0_g1_i1:73-639(+)
MGLCLGAPNKPLPNGMKGVSARRLAAAATISSVPITIESPTKQIKTKERPKQEVDSVTERVNRAEDDLKTIVSQTAKDLIEIKSVGYDTPLESVAVRDLKAMYRNHMERSIEIDSLWRGTSLMGLPHASTNLSQAAESPEDALERIVQDPEIVIEATRKMTSAIFKMEIEPVGKLLTNWEESYSTSYQ